eukprot:scaffold36288_cov110-Isochrysis_galbana.AAC.8
MRWLLTGGAGASSQSSSSSSSKKSSSTSPSACGIFGVVGGRCRGSTRGPATGNEAPRSQAAIARADRLGGSSQDAPSNCANKCASDDSPAPDGPAFPVGSSTTLTSAAMTRIWWTFRAGIFGAKATPLKVALARSNVHTLSTKRYDSTTPSRISPFSECGAPVLSMHLFDLKSSRTAASNTCIATSVRCTGRLSTSSIWSSADLRALPRQDSR